MAHRGGGGGGGVGHSPRPSVLDSLTQRYQQLRSSCQNFSIVQFGLCVFVWQPSLCKFQVTTLQCPLFPRFVDDTQTKFQLDRAFCCQPKCLQYIRAHGFDLNWWIDHGINFVSRHDQLQHPATQAMLALPVPSCQQVLEDLYLGNQKLTKEAKVAASINKEMHQFLTQTSDRILQFFAKHRVQPPLRPESAQVAIPADPVQDDDIVQSFKHQLLTPARTTDASCKECTCQSTEHASASTRAMDQLCCFVTEPLAPFRRQALALELIERLNDDSVVRILDCQCDNEDQLVKESPWKRRIRVVWVGEAPSTQQQQQQLQRSVLVQRAQQEILRDAQQKRRNDICGFTTLIQSIAESGVPIVGHNLLLDCMQCFDKFHGPLPPTCEQFVQLFHEWFPNVLDTKEMVLGAVRRLQFVDDHMDNDTSLEHVYEVLKKQPFHGPEVECVKVETLPLRTDQAGQAVALQAHQAGYDAFMTGVVFLRIATALGIPLRALEHVHRALTTSEDTAPPATKSKPKDSGAQQLLAFRNKLHVSHFVPHFSIQLDMFKRTNHSTSSSTHDIVIEEPKRDNFVVLRLVRTNNSLLKTFHLKQFLSSVLRGIVISKLRVMWEPDVARNRQSGGDNRVVIVELPSAKHVNQLIALRRRAKEESGTSRDPIPSIGCVEVLTASFWTKHHTTHLTWDDDAGPDTKKRKILDATSLD